MKHINLILSSILFCLFYSISAQNYVDLARLHYSSAPQNEFDSIGDFSDIEEFGADVTLPIKLNNDNAILTGFYLEQIKTKIQPLTDFRKISTINLKLGFNRNHSEKWNGTYMLLPKISSDFSTTKSKDFQIGGLILMKYKKSDNFKYHVGVYANNDLHGSLISPLFGFYYKSPNNKLEANFTLPIWADINYSLIKGINLGCNFTAITRTYYLGNDNAYLMKKTNELFGYLQFTVKKSFIVQTKVGYSIARSYEAYDEDDKVNLDIYGITSGDNRTQLNTTFEDGLIYKVRFIYRFHL
jgi:hypothetical protein